MSGPVWVKVCADADLAENEPRLVLPLGLPVLLVRVSANELYAISNKCPHMACPLHRGKLERYILTCPCHDWKFDIRSGSMVEAPEIKAVVYPVKIEEGSVSVQIEEGI